MSLKGALRKAPTYGSISRRDDPIANEGGAEAYDIPADGGIAAWLTVFGAFLALFCSFGQMNAFGTFQSWYTTHQLRDLHPSTVAWIGSVQLWVFFFSVSFPSDRPRAFTSAHTCSIAGRFHRPRVRRVWAAGSHGARDRHIRRQHRTHEHGSRVSRVHHSAGRAVWTRCGHAVSSRPCG